MNKVLKEFKKLPSKKQQEIRISYKKTHYKEYRHSIHLFIIYTIIGILGIICLFIGIRKPDIKFLLLYFLCLILLIICVILLNKSNEPFYKYLQRKLKTKK